MTYTLTRSRRKTIALYVRDGELEVRAPLKAPISAIEQFILSKEDWISDRLSKSADQLMKRESFRIAYGDNILYRGRDTPVVARQGRYMGFDDDCFYMPPDLDDDEIKATCVQIYRMAAKIHMIKRVSSFGVQMGVMPDTVKISGAKSRWGSCSTRKSLNFSWRLIMADDDVIDYVVVHELAHLQEMNHSSKFWEIVERVLPDYRERKLRLKGLQKRLSAEDWG